MSNAYKKNVKVKADVICFAIENSSGYYKKNKGKGEAKPTILLKNIRDANDCKLIKEHTWIKVYQVHGIPIEPGDEIEFYADIVFQLKGYLGSPNKSHCVLTSQIRMDITLEHIRGVRKV